MEPQLSNLAFDGLAQKIIKIFNGSGNFVGIVTRWATNTGNFTGDERDVLNMMQKPGSSAMVQRLSQDSESIAKGLVVAYSKIRALEGAYSLVKSYIDTAEAVITKGNMVDKLGMPAADSSVRRGIG